MPDQIHLAVALSDAGWHPGAWREPGARPTELLTGRYWADLVREAESGALDLVTLDDGLGLQRDDPLRPDDRTDRVRGRLDAVLVANRVAPTTRAIGLIPAAITSPTMRPTSAGSVPPLVSQSTAQRAPAARAALTQSSA